jgi:hypothetical protein
MIAPRVPHEDEIFAKLDDQGFERTGEKTATGEFWRHRRSRRHLLVPFSIQGYFPDWLCLEFQAKAAEIAALKPARNFSLIIGDKRNGRQRRIANDRSDC